MKLSTTGNVSLGGLAAICLVGLLGAQAFTDVGTSLSRSIGGKTQSLFEPSASPSVGSVRLAAATDSTDQRRLEKVTAGPAKLTCGVHTCWADQIPYWKPNKGRAIDFSIGTLMGVSTTLLATALATTSTAGSLLALAPPLLVAVGVTGAVAFISSKISGRPFKQTLLDFGLGFLGGAGGTAIATISLSAAAIAIPSQMWGLMRMLDPKVAGDHRADVFILRDWEHTTQLTVSERRQVLASPGRTLADKIRSAASTDSALRVALLAYAESPNAPKKIELREYIMSALEFE